MSKLPKACHKNQHRNCDRIIFEQAALNSSRTRARRAPLIPVCPGVFHGPREPPVPGVLPPELGACLCGHIDRDMSVTHRFRTISITFAPVIWRMSPRATSGATPAASGAGATLLP